MSFIDTIEIKNFKSIRHQKIEGCKKINLFIGYPNVGKSNILEALSLLAFAKEERQISLKSICRYRELVDLFFWGDKRKNVEVIAGDFVIALKYLNKKLFQIGGFNKKYYSEDFGEHSANVLKFMKYNREGEMEVEINNSEYHSPFDLKKYQFIGDWNNSGVMHDANDARGQLSFPFGKNLGEVVRNFPGLRMECGQLFAEFGLKLIFNEDQQLFLQKQIDDYSVFQLSLSQVADTLQRLIFYKAAIASNNDTILVFEEPEAHMFPPYIRKFTSDIIFDSSNQFFINTHSPYVLDILIEDAFDFVSVFLVDNKNDETKISLLKEQDIAEIRQYGVDLFFNIESYLNHGPVNNA